MINIIRRAANKTQYFYILWKLQQLSDLADMPHRISLCRNALSLLSRDSEPEQWAAIKVELGNSLAQDPFGDSAKNQEESITCFEEALSVRVRERMPDQWADTIMNLGVTYYERIRGSRAENIETALNYYRQALYVRTKEAMPIKWAQCINNLALAYTVRIHGDRMHNLEQAIDYYQQCLTVMTKTTMPIDWARIMHNLGRTYSERTRGSRHENLEKAIVHYESALSIRKKEYFPVEWARTMNNLAAAYKDLTGPGRAENLEKAIDYLEQTLTIRKPDTLPAEYAETMTNLGTIYHTRIHGDRDKNLEEAIRCLEEARSVSRQESGASSWLNTVSNLASAYSDRTNGTRCENVNQAIAYSAEVLDFVSQDTMPQEYRQLQINMGRMYFRESMWSEAAKSLLSAMSATELLYSIAPTQQSRTNQLRTFFVEIPRLVYALAKTKTDSDVALRQALLVLEQNRARWLAEQISLSSQRPVNVPKQEWAEFEYAREQVKLLQAELNYAHSMISSDSFIASSDELKTAHENLDFAISEVRKYNSDFMPALSLDDIFAVAKQLPVIYLVTSDPGGLALIVFEDKITPVWFELHIQSATEKWRRWYTSQYAYTHLIQNSGLEDELSQAWAELLQTIDEISNELWVAAIEPIAEALQSLAQVDVDNRDIVLIPTGPMSSLPFHLAWQVDDDGQRKYFLDQFSISYVPSARALAWSRNRATSATSNHILAVDDPKGGGEPLPFSAMEVATIIEHFAESKVLRHEQATLSSVLENITHSEVAHFACHGHNSWSEPLGSGLLMSIENSGKYSLVTVRHLLELEDLNARLAALSACETGIVGNELPDEVVMLPTALLQSGFAGVIASLWSVSDVSTSMLMQKFYNNWKVEKMAPSEALQKAQCWIRDTTNGQKALYYEQLLTDGSSTAEPFFNEMMRRDPNANDFEHPYWWAAFYLTGV